MEHADRTSPPSKRRQRRSQAARTLLALLATVALGLFSRLCPLGWWPYDKSLGDVLYAVAAYLALALVLPRQPPRVVALLALGWCVAVELLKLTGVPARYAQLPPVRWIFGTTFSWHNLGCYFGGIAFIAGIDHTLLRTGPSPNDSHAAEQPSAPSS
jgi:hypothetical protein